jgi:hypothetical protein
MELAQISFPGKITDAFSSLAKRSNFRAISKKLNLVCGAELDGEAVSSFFCGVVGICIRIYVTVFL